MKDILFRCSSIGKIMTEPMSIDPALRTPEVDEVIAKKKRTEDEKALIANLKARTLSETAKTYIRQLAAQEIYGVEFEVSAKQMEKGILVEADSIELLNRVRGLDLTKNTERRSNAYLTGECDLFDAFRNRGHDLKNAWSVATFPITVADCEDKLYEWQMRGYMALWNADEWEVNYALLDTPDHLIGYEPMQLHIVDHIPEHMRLTSWTVKRDADKEAAMYEKVKHAREYFRQVIEEFDATHQTTEETTA